MDSKTSVLVANDFPLVRNSMRDVLNGNPQLEVVACAQNKTEMLALADAHQPKVVVLDLGDWSQLIDAVKDLSERKITTLVMTETTNEEKTIDLLRAGANGVVSRRIDTDLLCKSVRAVASGEIWVSRVAAAHLIQRLRMQPIEMIAMPEKESQQSPAASPKNTFGLTRRELEIVQAIGEAMSNKDIATHFGISEYTVKHHLTRIFDKIGVYSRLELAMMARHHGLVGVEVEAVA